MFGYASYRRNAGKKKYSLVKTLDIHELNTVQRVPSEAWTNYDENGGQSMESHSQPSQVASPAPSKESSSGLQGFLEQLSPTSETAKESKEAEYLFIISGQAGSMVIGCSSPREATEWMDDLTTHIHAAHQHTAIHEKRVTKRSSCSLTVEWQPNEAVSHCPFCDVAFTLFVRRHHCRQCGNVVCGECSASTKLVLGRQERVCDKCSDAHQKAIGDDDDRSMAGGVDLEGWHEKLLDLADAEIWNASAQEKEFDTRWWRHDANVDRSRDQGDGFFRHQRSHTLSNRQAVKAVSVLRADPEAVCMWLTSADADRDYEECNVLKAYKDAQLVHATIRTIGSFWYAHKRDFVFVRHWMEMGNGSYSLVCKSVPSPLVPPKAGVTRGQTLLCGWIIRPVTVEGSDERVPNRAHVTYVGNFDPRGNVPAWLKERMYADQKRIFRQIQLSGHDMRDAAAEERQARGAPVGSWEEFVKSCVSEVDDPAKAFKSPVKRPTTKKMVPIIEDGDDEEMLGDIMSTPQKMAVNMEEGSPFRPCWISPAGQSNPNSSTKSQQLTQTKNSTTDSTEHQNEMPIRRSLGHELQSQEVDEQKAEEEQPNQAETELQAKVQAAMGMRGMHEQQEEEEVGAAEKQGGRRSREVADISEATMIEAKVDYEAQANELHAALTRGDSEGVMCVAQKLIKRNRLLEEQVLQVKDYFGKNSNAKVHLLTSVLTLSSYLDCGARQTPARVKNLFHVSSYVLVFHVLSCALGESCVLFLSSRSCNV